ncbi:CK1 family protein kinase [Tritrichomonas foetus]|uniref:non-specific serine/threonine protein kinase n=1 Tax=Tritrichomonas foetus TaxID=1144522 RepID=A0A1J4K9N3_9EUKA|nr:CK1 family protein kinase [Tritrichomonas foetus]|eukprot:OHT08177.1 CK1 family protein kinase [Tritrichomonas foetus]
MKPGTQLAYFELDSRIGEGGFGDVWKVINTEDMTPCAMKIEPVNSKRATLRFEAAILKKMQGSKHIPRYIFEGSDEKYYFLVEELLGPNLSNLTAHLPGKIIILPFLAKLADEMLGCVEDFHRYGYIHRDIKPQNFVVRLDGDCPICLIDYGISKLYVSANGQHLDARDRANAIGSPIYASLGTHNRTELSRRDDLISLMYSVLALSQFSLPWIAEPNITEIGSLKEKYPLSTLLAQISPQFEQVGEHIESLGFSDTPDYALMHRLLQQGIPQSSPPFEWYDITVDLEEGAPRGSNDPTGFLYSLCPYFKTQEKKQNCNIQ